MLACLDGLHLLAQYGVEVLHVVYGTAIAPCVVAVALLGQDVSQAAPLVEHVGLALILGEPTPVVAAHVAVRLLAVLEGEVLDNLVGLTLVVVYAPDVGLDVRVAAGIVDRACAVESFRHVVEVLHEACVHT